MTKSVTFRGETYERYDPRTLVDIDRDLAYHGPETGNESWFIVSNLRSGPDKIGLQVHAIIKKDVASLNISVVNETKRITKTHEFVRKLSELHIADGKFEIETDDFRFGGDRNEIHVHTPFDGAAIAISATRNSLPLLINGEGFTEFAGAKQYDYAFPRMVTSGTVEIEGESYAIDGLTWLDRQWGDLPDPRKAMAEAVGGKPGNPYAEVQWVWLNPQLSNGISISFAEMALMFSRKITTYATILYPDGTHVVTQTELLDRDAIWQSPATGNRYPTRFIITIPHANARLEVVVPFQEQEIVSEVGGLSKFEGMANVSGTFDGEDVTGVTYVELVGNWA